MLNVTQLKKLIDHTRKKVSTKMHQAMVDSYEKRIPESERFTYQESAEFTKHDRETLKSLPITDPAFRHFHGKVTMLDSWRTHMFYMDIEKYLSIPTIRVQDARRIFGAHGAKTRTEKAFDFRGFAEIMGFDLVEYQTQSKIGIFIARNDFNVDEFIEYMNDDALLYVLVPYENYAHLDKSNQG